MAYVPLWCKTSFSFLEGASQPEELLEKAHALGLPAMAVCDRDGVYGAPRAHLAAAQLGIRLIIGAQVTLEDGTTLILLVQNRAGYANLCRLITAGRLRSGKGACRITWDEVCGHANGLIAMWGGDSSLLVAGHDPGRQAGALRDAFGDRVYAIVARHRRDIE